MITSERPGRPLRGPERLSAGSRVRVASSREVCPSGSVDLFARYGYAVVFAGVFLENTGLPVPGETALLAGAALAHFGELSLAARHS